MTVLVDASVALKWFVQEQGSEIARQLRKTHRIAAPSLIIAEVANAAWKLQRIGKLPQPQLTAIVSSLPLFFDALWPIELFAVRAATIAQTLDHPVYDCFYLALSERTGQPLVTADRRLLTHVSGSQWQSLVVDLYEGPL